MGWFADNQWYVAAFAGEIGDGLLARTICGEPLVLYRSGDGPVTALSGLCAHRGFPLCEAPSRLVDGQIVCGYHGFTYAADGACVAVPGQTRIPSAARLTAYPVTERDGLVWVWIGDPAGAERSAPPRAPWLAEPGWTVVQGLEPLAARAGLLIDNLLDLSHETYLHGGHIGTPEVAETPISTEPGDDGVLRISRRMADAACPPFYAKSTGLSGRIVRWQDIEYFPPCLYTLHSRVAPTGALPGPDGSDPDGYHVEIVYAITPETEHSTHDFWAVARDFALDDEGVSTFLADANRTVVLQDVTALNALELSLQRHPGHRREVSIKIDTGGLAGRRMLARLGVDDPTVTP
ncbi:aromatic ring-hydroxylating dioxygenase subunit alpha [Acidiferrimicrobium sp. IK]|uniref:aromatic ring-hydroxylating dioxygenase subunit alpha n=1 Tax=Acidiferrimicrobium sp. IK TaxID=2871700 RepID=UPI0021CB4C27|nr:aromatic ring-hydroxylating dioxygenase subunit alpha [Acidiferrimicrobium sp. IK]MCU4186759.1 aromatic ring-hydroxylating dioxygenase subunit alpha [Acidiferrimicrobium sp. IK]